MSRTKPRPRELLKRLWASPVSRGALPGLVLGALLSQVLLVVFGASERSWRFVGVLVALLLVLVVAGLIWPPKPPAQELAPPKEDPENRAR